MDAPRLISKWIRVNSCCAVLSVRRSSLAETVGKSSLLHVTVIFVIGARASDRTIRAIILCSLCVTRVLDFLADRTRSLSSQPSERKNHRSAPIEQLRSAG